VYQDPYIYIGPGDTRPSDAVSSNTGDSSSFEAQTAVKEEQFLSLAVNTNQYGRTFQDRSYTFSILKRPSSERDVDLDSDTPALPERATAASSKIYNVNVRGKRGNIHYVAHA
jgi:hypothetical protein